MIYSYYHLKRQYNGLLPWRSSTVSVLYIAAYCNGRQSSPYYMSCTLIDIILYILCLLQSVISLILIYRYVYIFLVIVLCLYSYCTISPVSLISTILRLLHPYSASLGTSPFICSLYFSTRTLRREIIYFIVSCKHH